MRIPSTSDLVQAHSNRAYDKMEVISDHIHEIMALYDWIFNLREYLATKLAMYVSLTKDELISGQKSFLKTLRAPTLRLTSIMESLADEGEFTIGEYNGDPALLITFSQEIDDDTVVGTVAMAINRATETPYFAIPATVATESTSAVRVDYLNQVLSTLNSGSDALIGRVTAIENQLANVLPLDTSPTEGSHKAVTSNGIWVAIQNAINGINFPETVFPIATTEQKGIMQVGEYLTVNDGVVGVDTDALLTYLRQQLNLSGFDSGLLTFDSVSGGFVIGYNAFSNDPDEDRYAGSANPTLSEAIDITDTTQAFFTGNTGAGNTYLTPKAKGTAVSTIGVSVIKCTNLSSGVSNYYIPLRTVIIRSGREVGLPSYDHGLGVRDCYTIKCWFRNRDYTLLDVDKLEINDQANAFLATRLGITSNDEILNPEKLHIINGGGGNSTYTVGYDVYYDSGALE